MPQRMKGYTEFRGAPWPPQGPGSGTTTPAPATTDAATAPVVSEVAPVSAESASAVVSAPAAPVTFVPGARMAGYTPFRGQPWPNAGVPAGAASTGSTVTSAAASTAASTAAPTVGSTPGVPGGAHVAATTASSVPFVAGQRMAGYTAFRGAGWPPAPPPAPGHAETSAVVPAPVSAVATAPVSSVAPAASPSTVPADGEAAPVADRTRDAPPAAAVEPPTATAVGKPAEHDATSHGKKAEDAPTPSLRRRLAVAVGGVVVLGLLAVLGARGLMTLEPVADFVARYPGVPAMPEAAPTGVPAWLAWQHFFNLFLMTLIIRTGLQIRGETRPPANFTPNPGGFFAPKGTAGKKFSLTIWTHQALDVLWALNGLVFVVLLAVTGHWMRLIPLDPATPQHMLSTALQYATLDWPAHDGWLHYNALQMVAYSFIVFIAAPVAMLTGFRMSSWWPAGNERLNKAFPMELARRLHFPTMLVFAAFIVVHVALTLFSGVLTNLNAIFLARQAADWWGLVAFLAALAVTAAAWVLLKPAFLSPIAERFGRVGR